MATEQLVAIVRMDRKWKDDGARTQLLEFFEAWGNMDPATLAGRRLLSSVRHRKSRPIATRGILGKEEPLDDS